MKIAAVVFDRDGTLIEHVPYLFQASKVKLLPFVREGVVKLVAHRVRLFIHTNQSGIGRGLFGLKDVVACNDQMCSLLNVSSNLFERICIAPESPRDMSAYRKPSPRFANELINDLGFLPDEICYVGDRITDLMTAAAAGVRAAGVNTGLHDLNEEMLGLQTQLDFPIFENFRDVVDFILENKSAP